MSDDLIARLEALEGPDREVDAEIALRFGGYIRERGRGNLMAHKDTPNQFSGYYPEYTGSINDALTIDKNSILTHLSDIGGDGLPMAQLCSDTGTTPPKVHNGVFYNGYDKATREEALAIAICIASVKASADQ